MVLPGECKEYLAVIKLNIHSYSR